MTPTPPCWSTRASAPPASTRGQSHENGVSEKGLHRLQDAIDQALILLGQPGFRPRRPPTQTSLGRWSRNALNSGMPGAHEKEWVATLLLLFNCKSVFNPGVRFR